MIIAGPSIQEIRHAQPESLWHFLSQLPTAQEAEILYAYMIAGILGMIASWLLKWSRGDVGAIHQYFFLNYLKFTVGAVLTWLGLGIAAIAAGAYIADGGEFIGWFKVLYDGGIAGFGADLAINRIGGGRTDRRSVDKSE